MSKIKTVRLVPNSVLLSGSRLNWSPSIPI